MNNLRHLPLLLLVVIITSCATLTTTNLYQENIPKEVNTSGVNVFLIGDAGLPEGTEPPKALSSMGKLFSQATEDDVLLFLGDNIYPKGIPDSIAVNYEDAKFALELQTDIADTFPGTVVFMPGNHDWYSGLDGLKEQEELVEDALGDDTFLPKNGCPIETVEVSDDLAIIVIDTEWYIANWDDYPEINRECGEIDSREKFLEEFRDKLSDYQDRAVVLAMHHPLFTNGPHDGQFKYPFNPINVLRRTTGVVWEDLQHPLYREMTNRMITILQDFEDNVVVVSGHEHNLQYIERNEIKQIVSGAGSKITAVRQREGEFGFPGKGFAILNIDDFKETVTFYDQDGFPIDERTVRTKYDRSSYEIEYNFPDSITTSIYPKELFDKLPNNNFFYGERYRNYYGMEFKAPVVTLDTLYGGLSPVKLGGGFQTVNLRLQDKDGKEYAMRRMQKSAKQFLQREIFKDTYVKDELKGTVPETFIFDFYTTAYPFANLIVGDLANEVGVYHTNPKMIYIPKHNDLGEFNEEIGNELFIIEEQPSKEWGDLESFGKPDDVESSDNTLEKVFEDEENTIDEKKFIRARLFDMWLGDWDRHSDQFKWSQFEFEDGVDVYEPIPRDHDWVMPNYDGLLLEIGISVSPALGKMQSFRENIKDLKNLNFGNYKYDLTFIQNATLEDWIEEATYLENNLSDEAIEKAFLNVPVEARDDVAEKLKANLRNRRNYIAEWAEDYYKQLRKKVVLTATHKDDIIDINRNDDGTVEVKMFRNKDGERADKMKDLVFDPEITKEIWIYGLNDSDEFVVTGDNSDIRLNIIGGNGEDLYDLNQHRKLRVYDWASRESEYKGTIPTRDISDDYERNHFDIFKFQHNSKSTLPNLGYDPDSGVKLGAIKSWQIHKFNNKGFATKHQLSGLYHMATNGFEVAYGGKFHDIVKNLEFHLDARYTTPAYAENFFGYGNTTNFDQDLDFDYFRVRQEIATFEPKLIRKAGRYFDQFHISFPIERIDVENNDDRIVNDYFAANDVQLQDNYFFGVDAGYHFKNYDLAIDPSLGLEFKINAGYKSNMRESNDYGYLKPKLVMVYPLALGDRLKLSTALNSEFQFSDELVPFYFASSIGGMNGLRSYRQQRFTGENSFTHSTDLRFNINRANTFILPGNLGGYVGFDYGKVWMNDTSESQIPDIFEGSEIHTSYGGGLYYNASNLFTIRTSYFYGSDGGRVVGGFGFDF